jgi:hypothetical protein
MTSPTRTHTRRRTAALALLAPMAAAGLVATAGSAGAIPFEGDPSPTSCLRVIALPSGTVGPAGSTRFVSHGFVAVLVPRADC